MLPRTSYNPARNPGAVFPNPSVCSNDAYFAVFRLTGVRHSPNMADQISNRRRIGSRVAPHRAKMFTRAGRSCWGGSGARLEWWLSYRDVFAVFAFELEPIAAVSKTRGTQRRVFGRMNLTRKCRSLSSEGVEVLRIEAAAITGLFSFEHRGRDLRETKVPGGWLYVLAG